MSETEKTICGSLLARRGERQTFFGNGRRKCPNSRRMVTLHEKCCIARHVVSRVVFDIQGYPTLAIFIWIPASPNDSLSIFLYRENIKGGRNKNDNSTDSRDKYKGQAVKRVKDERLNEVRKGEEDDLTRRVFPLLTYRTSQLKLKISCECTKFSRTLLTLQ